MHINLPKNDVEASEIIALLGKGNILVKDDSLEEAACIDDIAISEEENEKLVIKGMLIDNFISERIVWGKQSYSGTIEDVMKNFVSNNCISPLNPSRIIPNFAVSQNRGVTKQASELNSYKNLAALIEEFALKYDVGWRVIFDLANKKYVFDVYQGNDLSINQDVNPRVIFSLEYENIHNQTYTDSESQYKNVVLVAGQGEGTARKTVTINDQASGFDRREEFVDARDLQNTKTVNGVDTPMTDEEYNALLTERGNSKLAEMQRIQTFESGISLLSNLIYKQDFCLGDIVTIMNNRWEIVLNTRITAVEEVYENDLKDIRVNFGSNIPTLIDKIQQKMR